MKRIVSLIITTAALAGCVSSQEIPLAMNAYQLEVSGTGRWGASAVPRETLRRAAQLTLEKGFTHFILEGATMQTGSTYAGQVSMVPVVARTRSNSVTVRMYRIGENQNALDARQILRTSE